MTFVFFFFLRQAAFDEDTQDGPCAGGKRPPEQSCSFGVELLQSHDSGYFRKDSSAPDLPPCLNGHVPRPQGALSEVTARLSLAEASGATAQPQKNEPDAVVGTTEKVPQDCHEKNVCEELRQSSRVHSRVERGSLASIRSGSSTSDEGKPPPRSKSEEPGTAVIPKRRGHHIARLIQSKSDVSERPIYPNMPYSPYGSPCSSPQFKRRPLKESRCVSIECNEEYTQLNQYRLKEAIGQVSCFAFRTLIFKRWFLKNGQELLARLAFC